MRRNFKYFKVTIKTESKVKSTDIKFTLGEPFQVCTIVKKIEIFSRTNIIAKIFGYLNPHKVHTGQTFPGEVYLILPRTALCLKILSSHSITKLGDHSILNLRRLIISMIEKTNLCHILRRLKIGLGKMNTKKTLQSWSWSS